MGDAPNKEEVSDIDMINEAVIEPAMRNVSRVVFHQTIEPAMRNVSHVVFHQTC